MILVRAFWSNKNASYQQSLAGRLLRDSQRYFAGVIAGECSTQPLGRRLLDGPPSKSDLVEAAVPHLVLRLNCDSVDSCTDGKSGLHPETHRT